MFAQGGGGALLLVLLKVDSADLYRETMTLLRDFLSAAEEDGDDFPPCLPTINLPVALSDDKC